MASSSQQIQKVDHSTEEKPKWLDLFLGKTFFDACPRHTLTINRLNQYCIDCDAPICRDCISSASQYEHRILKIYRHIYKDVVPLNDMENHIDCSKIQAYKCNKQWVLALNPLPHCGSGSNTVGESCCDICVRRLMDPINNRYCSIACKVEAFARKTNNSEPPFLSICHSSEDEVGKMALVEEKERKRKRKGIPHKAPK